MTPGWMNVRNRLAESYDERPRAMASLNWPVVIVLAVVSLAIWCIAITIFRLAL